MKYRVLEKDGVFYPQYFDYDYDKWHKFVSIYSNDYIASCQTLEEAYDFLRDQIPTQFVHPFPEQ